MGVAVYIDSIGGSFPRGEIYLVEAPREGVNRTALHTERLYVCSQVNTCFSCSISRYRRQIVPAFGYRRTSHPLIICYTHSSHVRWSAYLCEVRLDHVQRLDPCGAAAPARSPPNMLCPRCRHKRKRIDLTVLRFARRERGLQHSTTTTALHHQATSWQLLNCRSRVCRLCTAQLRKSPSYVS